MPRKYPEPCLSGECRTPAACRWHSFCRARMREIGDDYVPDMATAKRWRIEAARRKESA